MNEIINSVQDVVEKERVKPLPMKKGGNITIAPCKIPLAKGRLQQMRQKPPIPSMQSPNAQFKVNQYANMPNNAKTTKHTPYAPLVGAIGPHSSTDLMKGVHSNTPDARPVSLYSGTDDQAHRLKLAMRNKNGNLPSLSYQ